MRLNPLALCALALPLTLVLACGKSAHFTKGSAASKTPPIVTLQDAPELNFFGAPPLWVTDCNSPAHWRDGKLYVFNSWGHPYLYEAPSLDQITSNSVRVEYDNKVDGGRWMEATLQHENTLYGWYHFEPNAANVCPKNGKTAPKIGALVSTDNGLNWRDLGIVLASPPEELVCDTPNHYFAGGHGDFSVLPDAKNEYVYFFYDNYAGPVAEQGVSIARLAFADLPNPVGRIQKFHNGQWTEPGLGGRGTPIFPAVRDWHAPDPDVFWGPSIHWNTHLKQYVILLNRAIDPAWKQEGIYISFNPDLSDPAGWSTPERLPMNPEGQGPIHLQFYPQAFGTNAAARETDKLASQSPRLFIAGNSRWTLKFD